MNFSGESGYLNFKQVEWLRSFSRKYSHKRRRVFIGFLIRFVLKMIISNSENFWKIFTSEYMYQDCLDFLSLLDQSETPETYPLIQPIQQIDKWQSAFPDGNLLALWVACAQFIINFARNFNPSALPDGYFMCIAFTFYYPNNEEYLIPIIKVGDQQSGRNIFSVSILIESKNHSPEMSLIMKAFEYRSVLKNYWFYELRFHNPAIESEIVWIYCL